MMLLDEFLSQRLILMKPELQTFSLNTCALVNAKLQNVKDALDYDLTVIEKAVERVGIADAITQLDAMSQLVMRSTTIRSTKTTRKHEKTQPLNTDDEEYIDEE